MHHICSVVDHSGNEKLHEACQEGLAIVERAMATLSNDGVMESNMENEASEEEGTAGPKILVTVMGYLANAVAKRVRGMESPNGDCQDGTTEAITLLALVVTAKMVQVSQYVEAETKAAIDGGEPREGDECTAAKLFQSPDSITAPRNCPRDKVSCCGSMEGESLEGEDLSVFQRLSRLESSVGEMMEELRKERQERTAERQSLTQLVDMQGKLDDRVTRLEKMLRYSDK